MLGKANSSLRSHILEKKKDSEKEKPEMDCAMIKGDMENNKKTAMLREPCPRTHMSTCVDTQIRVSRQVFEFASWNTN